MIKEYNQVSTENFNRLKKHLSKNHLNISSDLFKATMYSMNMLSTYHITKKQVLDKVRDKYPLVAKKDVSNILNDMGFESKVKKETNKALGKIITMEYGYMSKVKNTRGEE